MNQLASNKNGVNHINQKKLEETLIFFKCNSKKHFMK